MSRKSALDRIEEIKTIHEKYSDSTADIFFVIRAFEVMRKIAEDRLLPHTEELIIFEFEKKMKDVQTI